MSLAERDTWRLAWLKSIYELTSLELQRRSWLSMSDANPHNSFVEFMCYHFDDVLADISYERYLEDGWVSHKEYKCIQEWHNRLAAYQSPNGIDRDPEVILNDPQWQMIVEMGAQARSCLLQLSSGAERDVLLGGPGGA